jgi:thioesterase domain-containing protein/acyl carrier protein
MTSQTSTLDLPAVGSAADPSSTEQILTQIWERLLGTSPIGRDQNYFDLGGDSSLAVQMFAEIEKIFGTKLPLVTLYEASTIAELVPLVQAESAPSGWSPVVAIQTEGPRPPFFCVHGAGGTVLTYRELSERLGKDQPFYGLQAQGLDGASPALHTVEEMAALYVKDLRRVQPQGPYYIGGYCMGGTVAYEMAQQLVASGQRVALLALFDTMVWHKIPLNVWTRTSHSVQQLQFHLAAFLSLNSSGKSRFLREKIKVAKARVPVWRGQFSKQLGRKADGAVDQDSILAHIWEANDRACWNYKPAPYPGEILDFRPKSQYQAFSGPGLKWETLALGGQKTVVLPVYPASMLVEPFVTSLASALRSAIDEAMRAGDSR